MKKNTQILTLFDKLKHITIDTKNKIIKKIKFEVTKRHRTKINMLSGELFYKINSYIHREKYHVLLSLRYLNREINKKITYDLIYREILSGKLSFRYPNNNSLFYNNISSEFNRAFNKLTIKNSHRFLEFSAKNKFINIKELKLCLPSKYTADFPTLISHFPNITLLDISMYNSSLTYDNFKLLSKYNIKTLILGYSQYHIKDEVLLLFENIEHLSLMHCNNITNKGFKNFKKLKILNLQHVPLVTTDEICKLNNLKVVTLKHCENIHGDLFKKMKSLETVEYESYPCRPHNKINDTVASYFTAKKVKLSKDSITKDALNILKKKNIDITIIEKK